MSDAQSMDTEVLASWPPEALSPGTGLPVDCSQSWSTEEQSSSMLMTGSPKVLVPRVEISALSDRSALTEYLARAGYLLYVCSPSLFLSEVVSPS